MSVSIFVRSLPFDGRLHAPPALQSHPHTNRNLHTCVIAALRRNVSRTSGFTIISKYLRNTHANDQQAHVQSHLHIHTHKACSGICDTHADMMNLCTCNVNRTYTQGRHGHIPSVRAHTEQAGTHVRAQTQTHAAGMSFIAMIE